MGANQEKAVPWRRNTGAKGILGKGKIGIWKGESIQSINAIESSGTEILPQLDNLEDTGDLYQRKEQLLVLDAIFQGDQHWWLLVSKEGK